MKNPVECEFKKEIVPLSGTSEEFSEYLKIEVARWVSIIKDANIGTLD